MRHLSRLLIRLSYVFIAVVAALYWGSGRPPDCAPPKGVSRVDYADTPAALLAALRKEAGEVVEPDEKFDATDVVDTGRSRRVAFIWRQGQRWIVATEKGGYGYSNPIFAYDLAPIPSLIEQRVAVPDNLCVMASDMLAAAP